MANGSEWVSFETLGMRQMIPLGKDAVVKAWNDVVKGDRENLLRLRETRSK